MDSVGAGIGVFAAGDDHQEVWFTEGNLFFLLVVFTDEVCQFFEDHQDMSNEELEAAMAQFDLTDFQKGAIHVMLFNPDLAGDTRDTIWEDFESIIVPHTVHCHGKFTSLNEEGDDPNIHTSRVLDILKKSDYDGYISIEWEGRTDHPTMPVLQRHVDFYRKTLGIQG